MTSQDVACLITCNQQSMFSMFITFLKVLTQDIHLPEQKLAIEVGDIDSVHVNHVDVSETTKCQVL